MGKFVNKSGQRFGKLVVSSEAGRNKNKKVLWLCKCDCGNETVVVSGDLTTGNTSSCGCEKGYFKHGGSGKGSYNTWRAMMRRCYNESDKDYKRYGATGVKVDPHWHTYENFVADMGEPSGDETLDRINVYGSYELSNCRWAGVQTQNRNTRIRANNKTGVTGVIANKGYIYAMITANKKKYYSKACETIEEAAAARKELERLHWGVA